jgi:antitoxin (DNA-binding transcriptional repressor) of toxin-antitoxin stability system
MYTTSVRELRAGLATAVRRAEAGESTVVTVHGRAVATLGPITLAHSHGAVTLDQLIASGAVLPARRRVLWRPDEPVMVWTGTRIDQALREIRG